jgi:hypothetical protein
VRQAQVITTGIEVGERLHSKGATYRQRKNRSKTIREKYLLEIIKEECRDYIDEDVYF